MTLTRLWGVASVLLVIVTLAGGWFLGVAPQLDRAASADEQREQAEITNQLEETVLEGLRAEAERLPEWEERLSVVRPAIPDAAAFPSFLQSLSDIASASGVVIDSFTSQSAQQFVPAPEYVDAIPSNIPLERFVAIPIRISVSGEQEGVRAFVQTLQSSERYMLINELRATREVVDGETTTTGGFGGTVFVFLDEPPESTESLDEAVDDEDAEPDGEE